MALPISEFLDYTEYEMLVCPIEVVSFGRHVADNGYHTEESDVGC